MRRFAALKPSWTGWIERCRRLLARQCHQQGCSQPKRAEQLALDYAHSLTWDNAIRLLHSGGIKRYSVGILVFMIGVITPFT